MRSLTNRTICIGLVLATSSANATTIDPLTWDQLLFGADFVGIVECRTAGEIVAGYAVVESWKGAPKGTTVTISMATNYWGQQAPIALVGEQYLMAAFKASPTRYNSSSSGGPVPMWWRSLPSDLRLPLFQGLMRLPISHAPKGIFETDAKTLEEFRAKAQGFLELSAQAQEAALLGSLSRKYFSYEYFHKAERDHKAVGSFLDQISKINAVAPAVELLLAFAQQHAEPAWAHTVSRVLGQAGPLTYEALKNKSADASNAATGEARERLARVWEPTAPKRLPFETEEPSSPALPRTEINRLRAALKASKDVPEGHVIEGLTASDCATMASYLAAKGAMSEEEGFGLGSYFAWRCGSDRRANLLRVTKAKDPMFRVAAAVYLAFEDERLGVEKLKELTSLPGDPGAWAAITLGRHGDEKSLGRALKVFELAPDDTLRGEVHLQLQHRLCVLLSNAVSETKAPLPDQCEWTEATLGNLEKWWATNGAATSLTDPWLPQLKARKVD